MKAEKKNVKINRMPAATIVAKIKNLLAREDKSLYLSHLQKRLQAMNS